MLTEVSSQTYSYINKIAFNEDEKSVQCKSMINWKFTDAQGNYYMSEESPLFMGLKS